MSHLQKQSLPNGRAALHLAQAVYRPGKTPAQSRIYLGAIKDEQLVVSKKFTRRAGHVIPMATIREEFQAGRLLEWLEAAPTEIPVIAKPKLGRPRKPPVASTPVVALAAATPALSGAQPVSASAEESPLAAKTRMANTAAVDEVGPWHVLETIGQECGLLPTLIQAFGKIEGSRLFTIACYQVVTGSPLYLMESWALDQPLPIELMEADFSSPGLSLLMEKLGRDCATVAAFHRYWIEHLGHPKSLVYDLTSISSYSAAHPLVEYGYNRDKEPLPQVNLALVVDAATSLPVILRALPGSIADVKTLKLTCDLLAEFGLADFDCRLDRGFDSEENLRDLLNADIGFTLAAKIDGSRAQNLIAKFGEALLLPGAHTFFDGERLLRHASDNFTVKCTQGAAGKAKQVKLHLYCDPEQRALMIRELERRCAAITKAAAGQSFASKEEAQTWLDKQENAQTRKAFAITALPKQSKQDKDLWRIEMETKALLLACRNFGFFTIYSSDLDSTREGIIEDYRIRDIAEKDLDIMKNENGQHRLRTGNPFVAQGRLVLAFISLVLHLALQKRMKAADLLKSYSVAELLGMLRRIRIIRPETGPFYRTEVPKKCVKALEALGIPLPE